MGRGAYNIRFCKYRVRKRLRLAIRPLIPYEVARYCFVAQTRRPRLAACYEGSAALNKKATRRLGLILAEMLRAPERGAASQAGLASVATAGS